MTGSFEAPNKDDVKEYVSKNSEKVVAVALSVAVVGTFWYARKSFKLQKQTLNFAKDIAQNWDTRTMQMTELIHAARHTGKPFTYYPGIGVGFDRVPEVPSLR